jgi:hypothetical protein
MKSEPTKKEFKKKIKWFLENKDSMTRCRRNWYLEALGERYEDFIPYKKYGRYGQGIVEYVSDIHSKNLRKKS